jgi:pyrroloquinoline quinone biosynthesis protein D
MSSLDPSLRPSLASGVRLKTDRISGDPVLLYPEGFLVLNTTAQEIVQRCDGAKTIGEIIRELADEFEASEAVLQNDILENLEKLRQQNLLSFRA